MNVQILDARNLPFGMVLRQNTVSDRTWYETKKAFLRSEDKWVGIVNEGNGWETACIWGLITPTLLSSQAYLWLYHDDRLVEPHKFRFIRHSQRQLEEMLKRYEWIIGHCLINNASGRQWLRWLGASFGEPKGEFVPFKIRAK